MPKSKYFHQFSNSSLLKSAEFYTVSAPNGILFLQFDIKINKQHKTFNQLYKYVKSDLDCIYIPLPVNINKDTVAWSFCFNMIDIDLIKIVLNKINYLSKIPEDEFKAINSTLNQYFKIKYFESVYNLNDNFEQIFLYLQHYTESIIILYNMKYNHSHRLLEILYPYIDYAINKTSINLPEQLDKTWIDKNFEYIELLLIYQKKICYYYPTNSKYIINNLYLHANDLITKLILRSENNINPEICEKLYNLNNEIIINYLQQTKTKKLMFSKSLYPNDNIENKSDCFCKLM